MTATSKNGTKTLSAAVLAAVSEYLARGWQPVALRPDSKSPICDGWPRFRYATVEEFEHDLPEDGNVGINLGMASGQLVDVDLDWAEALAVADDLLPPTGMEHGRQGAPRSHRWFHVPDGEDRTVQIKLKNEAREEETIVELRGGGGTQTMVPPSNHPDGEVLAWATPSLEPATATWGDLSMCVRDVATAAVLMRRGGWTRSQAVDFARSRPEDRDWSIVPEPALEALCACKLGPPGAPRPTPASAAPRAAPSEWSLPPPGSASPASVEWDRVWAALGPDGVAGLVPELSPEVQHQAKRPYVLIDCPHCGRRDGEAWISLERVPMLRCKHEKSCGRMERLSDYLARRGGRTPAEVLTALLVQTGLPPAPVDPRPEILVTAELSAMVDQAELVLTGGEVYQRGGQLVHVLDPDMTEGALPKIEAWEAIALREKLSKVARWVVRGKQGKLQVLPPVEVVQALAARREWVHLPRLDRVEVVPTILADGSVIQTPGYDPRGRVLVARGVEQYPPVPERPTQQEARLALDDLADVVCDFPFLTPADRSGWLALVLTLVARTLVRGPTPIWAIRAPTPALGKSKLVDLAALIATGREAPRSGQLRDAEEENKCLVSLGLGEARLLLLDNVERPLGSDVLASAATAPQWTGRVLGSSRMVDVPVPVLVATGNNLVVRGDLGRRVLPVDLAAVCEHPEDRTGWRHADVLEHVRANRPRLLVAALTVARWQALTQPAQPLTPWGSFERWSDVMRQVLVALGEPDPCLTRQRLREDGDTVRDSATEFLRAWVAVFGARAVTAREVLEHARDHSTDQAESDLYDALTALDLTLPRDCRRDDHRIVPARLGSMLKKINGRILEGRRIVTVGKRSAGGHRWQVEQVGTPVDPTPPAPVVPYLEAPP